MGEGERAVAAETYLMSVSFGVQRPAALGRPLPTADVGYPVPQFEGQLFGVEIARPTGASRPIAAGRGYGELSFYAENYCSRESRRSPQVEVMRYVTARREPEAQPFARAHGAPP